MSKALAFWIVYLVGLVVGLCYRRGELGGWLIFLLILVFLLGWAVFGFPIQ